MPFTVPALQYPFDALEPHIDKMTMEIHHDKHHGAYVTNLNKALESAPNLANKSVEELLATHHLLSGPRRDPASLPGGLQVISASHTDVQTTLLVRTSGPVLDPAWTVSEVGLEDLVLAYMRQAARPAPRNNHRRLEVQK